MYLSLKLHNANSIWYRTESNSIVEEIYDSYRIVREAYRYTLIIHISKYNVWYLQKIWMNIATVQTYINR